MVADNSQPNFSDFREDQHGGHVAQVTAHPCLLGLFLYVLQCVTPRHPDTSGEHVGLELYWRLLGYR